MTINNRENIVQVKSYDFAVKIVKLCRQISKEEKEYILTRQLLKSGTSIGANIEEAIGGQSKKDFIAKLSISYKEARESHYWIRLLKDTGYINEQLKTDFLKDNEELIKLIGAILITTKNQLKN